MQAKLKEATSLEKHVLLKKLRDALESLRGRVAGRNKDDVEEAIAMVSLLLVNLVLTNSFSSCLYFLSMFENCGLLLGRSSSCSVDSA